MGFDNHLMLRMDESIISLRKMVLKNAYMKELYYACSQFDKPIYREKPSWNY